MSLLYTSRKIFEFVSENLLQPSIWKIQRRKENLEQHPYMLCDESIIKHKTSLHLVRLYNELGSGRLSFTPDIDFTKVAQDNKTSKKCMEIIGGSHPNNFITLYCLSD